MITALSVIGSAAVGVIAAWLAGRLMRGNGFGLVANLVIGILGAVIGGSVLRMLGLDLGSGVTARLIVAFIGAVVVLFVVHVCTGLRDGHKVWS
ncbi:MAG TPA: GlsB/YeaQ/YmgE family stress response membrane protein [Thermoanaerobaculia bacterium]